jgi:carbamoylphosphate synthase large subunit
LTYIPFMRSLFESLKPDIVIPFIDQDVSFFAGLASEYNFKTPLNNLETAEICIDKYKTFEWLKKHGINTPNTSELENFESNKSDYIIKPRNGFGSLISSYNLENFNKAKSTNVSFIIQQRCNQPEITIDVFNSQGVFEYICRERIETKSGVCTKARLFRDESLKLLAQNISIGLNLKYFCFQVMQGDNDWKVTDINPRLGSGSPMSKVVGLDFFAAMVADLLGCSVDRFLQYINEEKFVTRQYLNILSK